MKLKELAEKYGEYEIDSTSLFGKCGEVESVTISLTKPKLKSVWDLEDGDPCYYVDVFGDIKEKYLSPLSEAVEMGNVFLIREEAEKDVERRKVETLLLKHGGRRWFKFSEGNYYIRYQREYGMNIENILYTWVQGVIYFDTREELTKAIEEIGAERILKALFGVR